MNESRSHINLISGPTKLALKKKSSARKRYLCFVGKRKSTDINETTIGSCRLDGKRIYALSKDVRNRKTHNLYDYGFK